MTLVTILLVYAIGYFLSILALKKYGKAMGFGDYDPPHDNWYDDYTSNAKAWTEFSVIWPIFWTICAIRGAYLLLLYITKRIIK